MDGISFRKDFESLQEQVGNYFAKELVEGSSIDPQVALERPYQLVDTQDLLKLGFTPNQLKGFDQALLIPRRSPDYTTALYQIKPVYEEGWSGPKYKIPAGSRMVIDVHPRSLKQIDVVDIPLWITEGAKQGDSLISRGLCIASLFGVSTFHVPGTGYKELLPCWDHIALEGREVIIAFDADAQSNNNVQHALSELVERLKERKANVKVIYVSEVNGNSKAGVDDWFSDGRSLEDLYTLATEFIPVNIADKRLAKYEELREHINGMISIINYNPELWKGRKGKTARSVLKHLTIEASKSGYMVKKGIKIQISQRRLALKVGVSRTAIKNSLDYLEENNRIKKDRSGLSKSDPDAFILLSIRVPKLDQCGNYTDKHILPSSLPSIIGPVSEYLNLRNSIPSKKPRRGIVEGTSKVRDISVGYETEGIKRLGKKAEHILDILISNGGEMLISADDNMWVNNLASYLDLKNGRKLKKFLKDSLESQNIVSVEKIGKDIDRYVGRRYLDRMVDVNAVQKYEKLDVVRLTPNWLDMLEASKEIAMEDKSAENQYNQYTRDTKNYHDWLNQLDSKNRDEIDIIDEVIKAKQECRTEDLVEPTGEDLREAVIEMLEELEDLIMDR